ncbi:hypothetical protein G7Y89_g15500 [Cudoniella acicularis]|uniref:Uncharacterized protein n=1 Tax=Cudoniella acicularis TaxID=354080 RepID=A0A8H4QM91_9HELO|nr:hypothetical protein G7Y89_g15500 [Cudoniella acicularis]
MEKSDISDPMVAHNNPIAVPSTALTIDSTTSTLQVEPQSERSSRASKVSKPNFISRMAHSEHHRKDDGWVKEIILGFADGLTVPFALTAGLSSWLVVIGGLAELFSGAISMGLGGYLAGLTAADHYKAEMKREYEEVRDKPEAEKREIYDILAEYNVSHEHATPLVNALVADPDQWVRSLPDGAPFFRQDYLDFRGIIPMIPYFRMGNITHALFVSIAITAVMLLLFGYLKNVYTIQSHRAGFKGAGQTLLVGAAAAAASYGIVRAIDSSNPIQI